MSEVTSQVDHLRKEALGLKRELDDSMKSKKKAERQLEQLKRKYIQAKDSNEYEIDKNNKEQVELMNLRKIKAKLQREKDLCKKECDKLENEL